MKVLHQTIMLFIQQMHVIFAIFGSLFILLGSLYLIKSYPAVQADDGVPPGK